MPFNMREDHSFFPHENGLISITVILDDCHSYSVHPVQCNIDMLRLLKCFLMRLLQNSIGIKVYKVDAQVGRHVGVIKETDNTRFAHF